MKCRHSLVDRETAASDKSLCPLCLKKQFDQAFSLLERYVGLSKIDSVEALVILDHDIEQFVNERKPNAEKHPQP
jgi:hypothetical protein